MLAARDYYATRFGSSAMKRLLLLRATTPPRRCADTVLIFCSPRYGHAPLLPPCFRYATIFRHFDYH